MEEYTFKNQYIRIATEEDLEYNIDDVYRQITKTKFDGNGQSIDGQLNVVYRPFDHTLWHAFELQ